MPTITEIQTSINNLTTGSDAHNFAILATQAVRETGNNVSSSVATVADLPDLSTNTIPNGHIVYVESLAAPVIARSDSLEWLGLNGALLRKDGGNRSILTWGFNGSSNSSVFSSGTVGGGSFSLGGEMGINLNGTISCNRPTMIAGSNSNWCDVSMKWLHTVALKTDGTLWAWGGNNTANGGALGNLTNVRAFSPVPVCGNLTWCVADAGVHSSSGIRNTGALYTWGGNYCGNLGNGTTVDRSSPGTVCGGGTWCATSSGAGFTSAIKSDATLWTWGRGGFLGDNTTTNRSSPGPIQGGGTWCRISSHRSTLAITTSGVLWAWGYNGNGQLGDTTTTNRSSPVTVCGGGTWCQIRAGAYHSVGIQTNGTAWTWGANNQGQLGDGTVTTRSSPVQVAGAGTTWCQISNGNLMTVAVKTDGTAWTWGYAGNGVLGDGTTANRSSPGAIARNTWCKIVSGGWQTAMTPTAINVE